MSQRQLAGLLGPLAEDVVGEDGLRVIRMRCVDRHMGKKNSQVVKHHGSGRMGTIDAEAETQLCQQLFFGVAHNGECLGLAASRVSSGTPTRGYWLDRQ